MAYIRQFTIEADRAYPITRDAPEERRVVSSLLRGLADCKLPIKICDAEDADTLEGASRIALAREAQREKSEQVIGHEPMELCSARQKKNAANKVLSIMDTMQRSMEQMHMRLQQT